MKFNKKILIFLILILFISLCGVYATYFQQSVDESNVIPVNSNETDLFGCCSIVLQVDNNESIMTYRRDSNVTANISIEKVNWHGIPVIKQYKTDGGYFNHVIITNDGWMIGLGGIDDGVDNEKCENITSTMINDNYTISESGLKEIQDIKKPYGRGHVLIKAPNGNYGFANVDKLKTGTLKSGQYISIPNNYSYSRSGNLSLDSDDIIKDMTELSQLDKYGLDRREIITYDFKVTDNGNVTDIYIANEDGSYLGKDYVKCIDDIHFDNKVIKGEDIPIAPSYKNIGSVIFNDTNPLISIAIIIGVIIFIVALFIGMFKLVQFLKFKFIN